VLLDHGEEVAEQLTLVLGQPLGDLVRLDRLGGPGQLADRGVAYGNGRRAVCDLYGAVFLGFYGLCAC
jgi:hypothetical protein